MSKITIKLICIVASLTSCSHTTSSFIHEPYLRNLPPKQESPQFFYTPPTKKSFRIGLITVQGNNFSTEEHLLSEAKKIGKLNGGDFILLEKSGIETKTTYIPGQSSFQSNSYSNSYNYTNLNGNANPYQYSCTGYGQQQALSNSSTQYQSVGPSFYTYNYPWRVFSLWVYAKARLGVFYDSNKIIYRFDINGNAEQDGLKIGDRIIGINGCDVQNQNIYESEFNIHPGDVVTCTILRNGEKFNFTIKAIEN